MPTDYTTVRARCDPLWSQVANGGIALVEVYLVP